MHDANARITACMPRKLFERATMHTPSLAVSAFIPAAWLPLAAMTPDKPDATPVKDVYRSLKYKPSRSLGTPRLMLRLPPGTASRPAIEMLHGAMLS
jgi:hypothetical protein